VKDAEKAAVFTIWGSGEQLLENYLICFHKATTPAHKSSNSIEFKHSQEKAWEMLTLSTMIDNIRVTTCANRV